MLGNNSYSPPPGMISLSAIEPNLTNATDIPPFITFYKNPTVVMFCISMWVLFLCLSIYAYRQGIKDENKVKVVLLSENRDDDHFAYLVTIVTGWRASAGTTAQIGFKIHGARGKAEKLTQSAPRRLWDPDIDRFSAGGEDSFILTTPASLGRLTHVEIWHDNSGYSPDWFLNVVAVRDLRSLKEWRFVYNDWLTVPRGREADVGAVARVSIPMTPIEEIRKSYTLGSWLSREFRDTHPVLSVFTRPPTPTFTRMQRLVCLFTTLQMAMLGSITYHQGVPTWFHRLYKNDSAEEPELDGTDQISLLESIVIGAVVALIVAPIPIHFILILFFKKSRPSKSTMTRIRAKTDWQGDTGIIANDQDYQFDLEQIQNDVKAPIPGKTKKDRSKDKTEWNKLKQAFQSGDGKKLGASSPLVPGADTKDHYWNVPITNIGSGSSSRDLSKRKKSKSGEEAVADSKSATKGSERRGSKTAAASAKSKSKKPKKSNANQNNNPGTERLYTGDVPTASLNINQNAAKSEETKKKYGKGSEKKDTNDGSEVKKKARKDSVMSKKGEKRDSIRVQEVDGQKKSKKLEELVNKEKEASRNKALMKIPTGKPSRSNDVGGQKPTGNIPAESLADKDSRGLKGNKMVRRSIHDVGFDGPPGVTYDPRNFWFPSWCLYIGWIVTLGISLTCTYVTMLYGLNYDYAKSMKWSNTMIYSLIQLFCVAHPLKILLFSFIPVVCLKKQVKIADGLVCAYADEGPDTLRPIEVAPKPTPRNLYDVYMAVKEQAYNVTSAVTDTWQQVKSTIQEIQHDEVEKKKELKEKMIQYFKINFDYMFLDISLYIVFAACVVIVTYGQFSPMAYWHHRAVKHLITEGQYNGIAINAISVPGDFYLYMIDGLIPTLYPTTDMYGQKIPDNETQTADTLTHRVGSMRLRQVRIENSSCVIPNMIANTIHECHAEYSPFHLDTRHYNKSWDRLSDNQTELKEVDAKNHWLFHHRGILHSKPVYGTNQIYAGGGYIYYLKSNKAEVLKNQILELKRDEWIDGLTRAVHVELSLYNPHVNLFTFVILVAEFTTIGNVQVFPQLFTMKLYPRIDDFEHTSTWFKKILIFLLIVYMVREYMKFFRYGAVSYLSNLYNLWEIVIISLSICVAVVYWKRNSAVQRALFELQKNLKADDDTRFVSLYDVAVWQFSYHYLLAILQMTVILKFLKLLKFIKRLLSLQMVIRLSLPFIIHFNFELLIMLIAFASMGHFLFGSYIAGYRDFGTSLLTLYNFLLGSWDYKTLRDASPAFANWYFIAFVITGIFFLLNMFISIISDSIAEVHGNKHIQDIEYEVLEYFYFRVKKFFRMASEKDLDEIVNRYYKKRIKRVRFNQ